jgi:exopolysaccharide biosynthesis WecB/TagA/CpsF family protein
MKSKNKYNFKFLTNTDLVFKKKKFIISALNLAFLAFFLDKKIKYNKHYILWPDGLFGKIYLKTNKIPGFKLLSELRIPNDIKNITVMGNLDIKELKYLKTVFKKKIKHVRLVNGSINKIIENLSMKFNNNDLILITLPTPKQEQLSYYLSKKILYHKIICIGGGLAMASGKLQKTPSLISNMGLEWLWRLRSDTLRRLYRLFYTFYIYIFKGIILKKLNVKFKKI